MNHILYIRCGGYLELGLQEGLEEIVGESPDMWSLTSVPELPNEQDPIPQELLEDADLILRSRDPSRGPLNHPSLEPHAKRVIVVDGSDYPERRVPVPCARYLKREYHPDGRQPWVSDSISFCVRRAIWDEDPLPWRQRDIDVFYAAYLGSNPIRPRILQALEEAEGLGRVVARGFDKKGRRLPFPEYLGLLRRSKIAVSPHGAGQDTNAYWEIPASGVALVAQGRRIQIRNNFRHLEDALFFDNEDHMLDLVRGFQEYDPEVEALALAGRSKVLWHHTAKARANEVVMQALAFVRPEG